MKTSEKDPETTAAAPGAAETAPAAGPRVYLGPAGPLLPTSTIFSGDLPEHVAALVAVCPTIADLIVPIAEAPAVMPRLADLASAEHAAAMKIFNHFKGVNNAV